MFVHSISAVVVYWVIKIQKKIRSCWSVKCELSFHINSRIHSLDTSFSWAHVLLCVGGLNRISRIFTLSCYYFSVRKQIQKKAEFISSLKHFFFFFHCFVDLKKFFFSLSFSFHMLDFSKPWRWFLKKELLQSEPFLNVHINTGR